MVEVLNRKTKNKVVLSKEVAQKLEARGLVEILTKPEKIVIPKEYDKRSDSKE